MKLALTRYDALGIALVAATATVGMSPVFADVQSSTAGFQSSGASVQNIGSGALTTVTSLIQGNIGLAAGIAFAALGAYLWLVKQETGAGIGAIIFGAILALVPNILNSLYSNITSPIISTLGGGSATSTLGH